MRLNLGCGVKRLESYINVDIDPSVHPEILLSAIDLKIFNDCTVDEIFGSHLIDHLSYSEFDCAIREWHRVLKHGGYLVLECPDFEALCKEFLRVSEQEKWVSYQKTWHSLIKHFYGKQSTPYQYHKNGFTKDRLTSILMSVGFGDMEFLEPDYKFCPCIKIKAVKP